MCDREYNIIITLCGECVHDKCACVRVGSPDGLHVRRHCVCASAAAALVAAAEFRRAAVAVVGGGRQRPSLGRRGGQAQVPHSCVYGGGRAVNACAADDDAMTRSTGRPGPAGRKRRRTADLPTAAGSKRKYDFGVPAHNTH